MSNRYVGYWREGRWQTWCQVAPNSFAPIQVEYAAERRCSDDSVGIGSVERHVDKS